MTSAIIFLLIFIGLVLSFLSPHQGFFAILFAGFLQDPLRKLAPDEPVYYTVLVVVFAAVTFIGAKAKGAIVPFGAIPDWNPRLKTPIELFVLLVIAQCFATLFYSGSVVLAGIGLLVYLAPFPALMMAYSFASSFDRVRAFLWLYVALSAAMELGVYLSWLGIDWDILRSVGESLVVYSADTGDPLELPSGFLRAPEVAAWHAASGACIALLLGLSKGRKDFGLASAALVVFFVGAVMLTGRRKFLLEIAMFLPIFWFLLRHFRMTTARVLHLILAGAVVSAVVIATGLADENVREGFRAPVMRGQDTEGEVIDRMIGMTIGSLPYIIADNGILGSGAGSGSGGAQYYGGGDDRVGGSAEGGLGKMLAELGVPGILLFFWLAFRFAMYVWRTLALAGEIDPESGQVAIGLAAFLAANGVVFATAHQVYSDPFILLLIGSCFGFIVATRRFEEAARLADASSMQSEGLPIWRNQRRIV